MKLFNQIIAGSFLAGLMLTACSKDPFSQIVTIDIPEHKSALAISTSLMDGDSVIKVLVSQSLGIVSQEEHSYITDAEIKITFEGESMADLDYDTNTGHYLGVLPAPLIVQPGTYRLEASAPGFDPVWSEQVVGDAAEIREASFEYLGTVSDEGKVHAIRVTIDDPPGEHFYALDFFIDTKGALPETENGFHLYVDSNDPIIEYGWEENTMLTDDAFDGKSYKVLLYSPIHPFEHIEIDGTEMLVQLKTLSPDKYYFERSRSIYTDAKDFPFTEPVVVHDNIQGGHGIFTVSRVSEIRIPLSK